MQSEVSLGCGVGGGTKITMQSSGTGVTALTQWGSLEDLRVKGMS